MDFIKVSIYTSSEGLEPLSGLIENAGVSSFQTIDAEEFSRFLHENSGRWDYVDEALHAAVSNAETTLILYLPDNGQGKKRLCRIQSDIIAMKKKADLEKKAFGRLETVTEIVSEEDWANNWKKYFRPIKVGKKLLVTPSWEDPADAQGRMILKIDPGSSFGTGQHDTTRLCMELIEENLIAGRSFLDLGCGSGILTAAALLLGAGRTCSVDVEQHCVDTARQNVGENMEKAVHTDFFCGDITRDKSLRRRIGQNCFQLVAVNIVADVIIAMCPYLGGFLAPCGILVVSGIIEQRAGDVFETLKSAGYQMEKRLSDNSWVAAAFVKKGTAAAGISSKNSSLRMDKPLSF